MHSLASGVMCLMAIFLLSGAARSEVPTPARQLPSMTGDNLNSKTVALPQDLSADHTLLFIAFDQNQQSQIDSWTKGLKDSMTLPWLEIPVIEPSNAFVRAMIAGGMRRDIVSPEVRDRVIAVYTAPDPVARAVGCMNYRKQLCVAVVEKSGSIRFVLSGPYNVESARQIVEQMNALHESSVAGP